MAFIVGGCRGRVVGSRLSGPAVRWPAKVCAAAAVTAMGVVPLVPGSAGAASSGAASSAASPVTPAAASPTTTDPVASSGYYMATNGGESAAFGGLNTLSQNGAGVTGPVAAVAALPTGGGYWMVGQNGSVAAYGTARNFGGLAAIRLAQPIVGMAPTSDGGGYWLVAADGGVFAFGDAGFYGSMGGIRLNQPVVGMAAAQGNKGYWLVASDGGVFAFGDAGFYGSTGGIRLNQPVVGMAATGDDDGYWLVAADGGIFTFGDAPFRGSASGTVPAGQSVVGMAESPGTGTGVIGTGFPNPGATGPISYPSGATGYDISWPQCGASYPPPSQVAVVGVNDGYSFSTNPCLPSEASWGGPSLSLYLNLNSPQGSVSSQWATGPAGTCALGDLDCESYNYGYNTAVSSILTADATQARAGVYWLDIETDSYWTSDTYANSEVIAGAIAGVRSMQLEPAVYSTNYQWGVIAGSYQPLVPVWYPTGIATADPGAWCYPSTFAGSPVRLVQSAAGRFDGDYSC